MFSEEDCVMSEKNVYVGGYSRCMAVTKISSYWVYMQLV